MIVGIDASLTNTAVAAGDATNYRLACFHSQPRGESVAQRLQRYMSLVSQVYREVCIAKPDAIFLEGYSYSSNTAGIYLAEYGALLRWHLSEVAPIHEVPPATLKQFATGKGIGKKEQVIAHLTKRYGVIFDTNDEYDAFALYKLGCVAHGLIAPATAKQAEAAAKALTPKARKGRKK